MTNRERKEKRILKRLEKVVGHKDALEILRLFKRDKQKN